MTVRTDKGRTVTGRTVTGGQRTDDDRTDDGTDARAEDEDHATRRGGRSVDGRQRRDGRTGRGRRRDETGQDGTDGQRTNYDAETDTTGRTDGRYI